MPITESAKKALRSSAKKRFFNLHRKDEVQTAMKKFKKLVAAKSKKEAQAQLSVLQKALDKAAKTHLLKKNTVARKKSRLAAMVRKIA